MWLMRAKFFLLSEKGISEKEMEKAKRSAVVLNWRDHIKSQIIYISIHKNKYRYVSTDACISYLRKSRSKGIPFAMSASNPSF